MRLTCAFTGHRPKRFSFGYDETAPLCLRLKAALTREIQILAQGSVDHFITGMAQGVDTWAAEAVLHLRQTTPLTLTAVLPFPAQAANWVREARNRHAAILKRCDETVVLCQRYLPGAMKARDRWLVDHAHLLLAVYDGSGIGGTAYTIRYAQDLGKPVLWLHPETLELVYENQKNLKINET